jgi:maleate isomerase
MFLKKFGDLMEKAKLGVLVPSSNTVMEPDLYKMVPEGVTLHFTRIRNIEDTKEELSNMINYVASAAELLSHAKVDVIAFGCTGGSFIGGRGYDKKIIQEIERATKTPGTTTTTAVVEALKELKIRKLTLATPYEEWLTRKEVEFLEDEGFSILSAGGLGLVDGDSTYPPKKIKEFVKKLHVSETDGIFISCTNFRAVDVINDIEEELDKPVVTSNQATLWMMLKMVNVGTPIYNYGKLLETL